jgi:hypothetical protein
MFIRVYRKDEDKEILVNTDHIWKIEITYAIPDPKTRRGYATTLKDGLENPNSIKIYKVFFGADTVSLTPPPDDPVRKVMDDIYKNAVKGSGSM